MLSVLGFLIILGPLVIVHEFGHYIFARIFGVKAEVFSVGFGPKIWSRQCGETEVRVSAVPLGGYVKLLGEDRDAEMPEEEQKRALHRQAAWKRFFIFFGGPLFNFLFAVVVFMAILAIGEPQVASVAGRVVHGSAAEKAGFRSGDRILSVDGKPVKRFDEILDAVEANPGKPVEFQVQHPGAGAPVTINAVPGSEQGFSAYGEATRVGEINGLYAAARAPMVGVSDPRSPAAQAGIKTGDQITEVNGAPIQDFERLESDFSGASAGTVFRFKIKSDKDAAEREVDLTKPAGAADMEKAWGLYSSELFVEKTIPRSPAEGSGILRGDRLIGVGGETVPSFFDLRDAVQRSGERDGKVVLDWERLGRKYSATITPTATTTRDPLLKKTTQFTVGVVPMLAYAEPPTVVERVWNPFKLLFKGSERMVEFSWRNFVSIRKMITGDVSVSTLGGPIMIGKIAGESLSRGLIAFLTTMAMLSVGLGVLNVLPVPVLDGGHLLLLAIEAIRGKPLTMRTMEIIQGVGLSLILLLMVIVLRNDLARLPLFD